MRSRLLTVMIERETDIVAAREVVDSAGRKVTVPDRVERIMAAGPPASVLVYMLGPQKLVGWNLRPREAELPYAIVAMVTDYDCWHPDHDHVTVEQVVRILNDNAERARTLLKKVAPRLGPKRTPSPLGIEHTLDTALITAPEKRDPVLFAKLDAVAGRVLKKV